MTAETRFSAPWSRSVKIVTVLCLLFLSGLTLWGAWLMPADQPRFVRLLLVLLPALALLGTLPFIVRGYVVTSRELLIERLGWRNHIPLGDVTEVRADAEAMRGSLRLCGVGGLFGYFGWFRNRALGVYRAYCTAPANAVVIRLRRRTLVVTPGDPAAFVAAVTARAPATVAAA